MRKQINAFGLLVAFILSSLTLNAQNAKLQKADQYLEALRYEDALRVYHKLYRKDNESVVAVAGLATVYQKAGNLEEATTWYEKAIALPNIDPEVYFNYGQVLLLLEDCVTAQEVFNQYLSRKPYDGRRSSVEDVCSYLQTLKEGDFSTSQVSLLEFNGEESDLAPAFYKEGIVFGSVRTNDEKKGSFYDLYYTSSSVKEHPDGLSIDFSPVEPFLGVINSDFNEAIITFSPDEQEVYFTRNQDHAVSDKNPLRRLEIRVSKKGKDDESWSRPERLNINSINFNNAHPSLSPDGNHLYFSSDRPGGFGGKDIYRCDRYGLSWGTPVNLGPEINTAGDEMYPSFHANGVLYFASNGHLGLGGLDVFRAEDIGKGHWGNIKNMGVPVNSPADDFGLIVNSGGNYGFFTSNREGGIGGDDIYLFQHKKINFQLQFTNAKGELLQRSVAFSLAGTDYLDFSNDTGLWQKWLEPDECLFIKVRDDHFEDVEIEVCAASSLDNKTLVLNWPLLEHQNEAPVYAAKGGSGANYLHGVIYDELSRQPIAEANLKLRSISCGKYINLSTDENGAFNYRFADECCYELIVAKEGYFTGAYGENICKNTSIPSNGMRINLTPYRLKEEHELVQQATTDDHFKLGAKVYEDASDAIPYLLNIYYDLGRSSVRAEAIPELNRLYFLMINNPDITIEISSHTDARGSYKLNKNLSQRRATAIVNWLVSKGISKNRLIARGYGEDRLVNECEDGIDCNEEDHQLNRRTEFRVLDQELGHSY